MLLIRLRLSFEACYDVHLRCLLFALAIPAVLAAQQTIKFEPTAGVPTFAVRQPVLRIKPGTTVETGPSRGPVITTKAKAARGRAKSAPF